MKIRLTPGVLAEMRDTLMDAAAGKSNDPSHATYRKIHDALNTGKLSSKGLIIDLEPADIEELKSRSMFNIGSDGICRENLGWSSDPVDRGYWLGRMRAYESLYKQLSKVQG